MTARIKPRYSIVYYGHSGPPKQVEVEADAILLLEATATKTLMCWQLRGKTVFAIPFYALLETKRIAPPKIALA